MLKRGKNLHIKGIAFSEIFILIIATLAFAFVLGEASLVSADVTLDGVRYVERPGAGWFKEVSGGLAPVDDSAVIARLKAAVATAGPKAPSVTPAPMGNTKKITDEGTDLTKKLDEEAPPKPDGGAATGTWWQQLGAGTIFSKEGKVTGGGALTAGLVWAAGGYLAGQAIGSMTGMDKANTEALSAALAAGAFTFKYLSLASEIKEGVFATKGGLGGLGAHPFATAAIVAAIVFTQMYVKENTKTVTFTCRPWEAPIGGTKCEECNKYPFRPCSEYRCKALGQTCDLLNKETPGKELCAAVDPKDAISPTITPSTGALSPIGLSYVSDTSIRPPALGVKVVDSARTDGCLKAFTPLQFGITTSEPAQCKVSLNHTSKIDDMEYYFGESNYYEYNHTQKMRLPSPASFNETGGSPLLQNGDTMQLFVRCMDRNGNQNVDEYSVKFCIDKSPDTTPPLIEGTSITSGNPVRFGTTNISVETYVNEPAECKWSIESKAYEDMENSMACELLPVMINAMPTFLCTANFTGLKNNEENKYYIRCKDQPDAEESKRNVMVQSYELILRGTQPLNIIEVLPNKTITGSTTAVAVDLEVETDDGAEEGKAFCFFSPFGTNDSYVQMFETNNFKHKQTLQLTAGSYTYYFRCTDLGGNSAEKSTTFSVFSDLEAPKVARVYKEEGVGLKVVTNEDAECKYSLNNCNFVFAEGLSLIYSNPSIKTNSYVEWKPNTIYYIKCKDLYGNEPNPNECSVIVKPVEVSAK